MLRKAFAWRGEARREHERLARLDRVVALAHSFGRSLVCVCRCELMQLGAVRPVARGEAEH